MPTGSASWVSGSPLPSRDRTASGDVWGLGWQRGSLLELTRGFVRLDADD